VLAPYALCTLAELKADFGVAAKGKDSVFERAINRASREVEAFLSRRIVFRAPTEDDDAIVADVALTNGSLVLAGPPAAPGRTTVVTVIDPDRTITAGTLTLTGTVAGVPETTEVYDLTQGPVLYGTAFFSAYSDAVVAGLAGTTGSNRIRIGNSRGYLDYYTLAASQVRRLDIVPLIDWPVRQILTVHEDAARVHGGSTLLLDGTDYLLAGDEVGRPRGALQRMSGAGGAPMCWNTSFRAIRLQHSAGYFTRANVPAEIKGYASRLAKLYYDDEQRGNLGVSGASDKMGNWTRFGRPGLDPDARRSLSNEKNYAYLRPARDFDLEAA
jgi:hypothetical protein